MSARASSGVALASALAAALISNSCGILRTREPDVRPAFWEHRPEAIHVRFVRGDLSRPDAAAAVRGLIEGGLEQSGYRVGPGGDASLEVAIDRYGRQAVPASGEARFAVALSAELIDRATGALLWSASAWAEEDADDEGGEWSLLGSAIDYALDEAFEPLLETEREQAEAAVLDLLHTLPGADAVAP